MDVRIHNAGNVPRPRKDIPWIAHRVSLEISCVLLHLHSLSSRLAILFKRMITFDSGQRFELVDTGQRCLECEALRTFMSTINWICFISV